MNMNLPSVVTPPSVYHGCSNWKTFWEEKFALAKNKNCDLHNNRKHRETKDGEKYTTLDISLNFGSLDNMKIKSPEPKYH